MMSVCVFDASTRRDNLTLSADEYDVDNLTKRPFGDGDEGDEMPL